ncbi:HpcH/HpaI aldolase family protein [Aliiruegeria sabulilitoris]|uniref:HpcH/HpaI aldolase family protein n=1 Tax=Aliiruegeria sabulilitoris TaxID=1510458 RepID=UPI00082A2DE8|nr:HpcH/HpaI aldolase/citrate lyase family protein [Aliiruegeria sabulilitoris]NDR58114.1 HpcH/HpaI aldolase/citrate lyase family protein [Pseudoruegeria sp. M32A2M]
MPAPKNTIKQALAEDRLQMGCWLNLGHPAIAAIAASAGFDWCLVDAEHGPNTLEMIHAQLNAMQGHPVATAARVPWGEGWILKQVLDLGVQTVVVPMVDTPEQAAQVVAACKYPPEGIRGRSGGLSRCSNWGQITDYEPTANDEICVIVQAETETALSNLTEITKVPGVDCVFVGPADLSADMGFRDRMDAPEVKQAIEDAIVTIHKAGKPAGIISYDAADYRRFVELGVRFIGVGADAAICAKAIRSQAAAMRELLS